MSSIEKIETTFQVNEQVVYPLQGVGKITDIEKKKFKGKDVLYYIIYLEVSDMTVMVPCDKTEDLGIRAIVSVAESEKALTLITEDYEPVTADWKMRYQMNLDLLKSGSVSDIATVVRALYHRSKIKELPILERKLLDTALTLLVDEISFSLGKTKSEVEQIIFSKLEVFVKTDDDKVQALDEDEDLVDESEEPDDEEITSDDDED